MRVCAVLLLLLLAAPVEAQRPADGRGFQYGAHLVSPIYVTTVRRADEVVLSPNVGFGILARLGWELPAGFSVELVGGFAMNGVDTMGRTTSSVLTRTELGGALRYLIFNDSPVVPFVQAGGMLRWFFFQWSDGIPAEARLTGALVGAFGAQFEVAPYFAIEAGVAVEYTFESDLFAEGLFGVLPFLGVTLYVYDSSGY